MFKHCQNWSRLEGQKQYQQNTIFPVKNNLSLSKNDIYIFIKIYFKVECENIP